MAEGDRPRPFDGAKELTMIKAELRRLSQVLDSPRARTSFGVAAIGPTSCLTGSHPPGELDDEVAHVRLKGLRDLHDLDEVKTPLATLVLRHE